MYLKGFSLLRYLPMLNFKKIIFENFEKLKWANPCDSGELI